MVMVALGQNYIFNPVSSTSPRNVAKRTCNEAHNGRFQHQNVVTSLIIL
jgi:hypothetical protein